MRYNVGDTVKIRDKEWFETMGTESIKNNPNIEGNVKLFLHLAERNFGKTSKVTEHVHGRGYKLEIDNSNYVWPYLFIDEK